MLKRVKALSEGDIYVAARVMTSNCHMVVLATKGLTEYNATTMIEPSYDT